MRVLRALVVVAILVGLVMGFFVYVPYGPGAETFVDILPGTGTLGIARQLQKAGIVRSALAFDVLVIWKTVRGHGAGSLKAGEYRFDHSARMEEVYDRLRQGDVYTVTLVIPEGYNIFDIANAVAAARLDSREDFLNAERKNTELIADWVPQGRATSLEGYLFPDTYKFSRHATPILMLTTMVRKFGQEARRLGMTPDEVSRTVTMASLVEKEVHIDMERPEVVSVFENRLAAGMPLQTDPAVIYASLLRGTWTGVIHQSELKSDSAYNTYTHAGLPPGPICNPGIAALQAALHPAKTGYLYFVADPEGTTKFAATLAEHNANVAAYRIGMKP
ncbi:MAG TPA: endolytic transglycosylase MltG [Acidobacteriaceae bacterium]|nr:endolytic transglycosylase MltG [Acidobacteriaceae bacterium]